MRWRTFALWNALGGVAWATSLGLLAYALGRVVERIFAGVGVAAVVIVVLGLAAWWLRRRVAAAGSRESSDSQESRDEHDPEHLRRPGGPVQGAHARPRA